MGKNNSTKRIKKSFLEANVKNDIEVLIALSDMSDLSDFLMTKLLKVRGVRDVEAALAVDIHKYEFEVAPV